MRTVFIGLLGLITCFFFASCNSGPGHSHGHVHEHAHAGHEAHAHGHGDSHGGNSSEIVISEEQAAAAGISSETAAMGPFRNVLPVSGKLYPAPGNEVTVVANVAGTVSYVSGTAAGTRVKKGDILFAISSANIQNGEPVRRAAVAYWNAEKEYERALALVDDGIVSRREFESIKARYETARIAYEAVAGDEGTEAVVVRAPMDGYISSCLVGAGEYAVAGQPLMTITDDSDLYLQADVSERYLGLLPSVKDANFMLPYSDKVYSVSGVGGRLLAYGRSAGDGGSYIPMTFELDGSEDMLPGSYARVWLLSGVREDVMSLPLSAITEEQGHYFVYIRMDASCYRKQEVTLGASDGNRVEILTGLKEGENVVTEGAIHVRLASASNAIPAHSHNH